MFILCDLDGTVADNSHRAGFIQSTVKDWDAFYQPDLILQDKPIDKAVKVVNRLITSGHVHFAFLTGRPERTRQATETWLGWHTQYSKLPLNPKVYMRKDGDHTSADKYKEGIISYLQPYGPFLFIDDDLRNVDMYWRYGLFLHAPSCWDSFHLESSKTPYGPHPG